MPSGRNGKNGKRPADTSFFRIENRAGGDEADVYIYDEISWFWGITAADFVEEIKGLAVGTLNVFINSPGGDVFDGLAIMNALRRHTAKVNIVVDGLAASAASFIAVGAGDTVTMMPNSQMMIHNATGGIVGNAADLREWADMLDKQDANIAEIYAKAAARRGAESDVEHWAGLMTDETWFMASEAVEAGLADQVGEDDDEPEEDMPAENANRKGSFSAMREQFKHRSRDEAPTPPAAVAPPQDPPAPPPVMKFDPDMFRKAVKEAAK